MATSTNNLFSGNDALLDFLCARAHRYEPSEAFVERVQARLGEDVFRILMVIAGPTSST